MAELLGADVSVDRLVKYLQSHDATFEQVLSKMRKLRDTVRKRRPAAVPFFKLGYYVGLHVRDVDYGSNGDGTVHGIASGPLDDVASAIITAGVAGNAANGNSSKPTLPIATVSYNDSPSTLSPQLLFPPPLNSISTVPPSLGCSTGRNRESVSRQTTNSTMCPPSSDRSSQQLLGKRKVRFV